MVKDAVKIRRVTTQGVPQIILENGAIAFYPRICPLDVLRGGIRFLKQKRGLKVKRALTISKRNLLMRQGE